MRHSAFRGRARLAVLSTVAFVLFGATPVTSQEGDPIADEPFVAEPFVATPGEALVWEGLPSDAYGPDGTVGAGLPRPVIVPPGAADAIVDSDGNVVIRRLPQARPGTAAVGRGIGESPIGGADSRAGDLPGAIPTGDGSAAAAGASAGAVYGGSK